MEQAHKPLHNFIPSVMFSLDHKGVTAYETYKKVMAAPGALELPNNYYVCGFRPVEVGDTIPHIYNKVAVHVRVPNDARQYAGTPRFIIKEIQ